MGDFGVRSANMFDLLQPQKSKGDSTEKAPAKSAAAKAKKAEAKAVAAPQAAPKQAVRTGNKRGGFANKGTRPTSGARSTTDHRVKRTHDRQSELNFTKSNGGARKSGLNFGGNADLQAEAANAAEEFNAGAKDAAATTEGKDEKTEEKKEEKKEEPDPRKTLAQFEAEQAAKAVEGDKKVARAVVVGKEFKAGAPIKKNKAEKESLFSDVKTEAEAKKAAEAAKDAKPAKKGKESKTAAAKAPAPKPQKIVLDQFNETVKPPPRPEPVAREAKPEAAPAKQAGGARGGRGGRGARGGRGGRGAARNVPDFAASFPPLGGKA